MSHIISMPEPSSGIKVNFCKHPSCENFGQSDDDGFEAGFKYRFAMRSQNDFMLVCRSCEKITILKSNSAIAEEFRCFNSEEEKTALGCPSEECGNFHKTVAEYPRKYYRFGTSSTEQSRYRYKECLKTFSEKKGSRRHRRPEINERVFLAFVNRVPFNRICEIENIQSKTFYDKRRFYLRQMPVFFTDARKTTKAI